MKSLKPIEDKFSNTKSSIDFFPREKAVRLQDAFIYLLLLGTFGVHQFYLGNKKRAYYLLSTCGASHLMVILAPKVLPLLNSFLAYETSISILLIGYALGAPVWIGDFITLPSLVRAKNGQKMAESFQKFFKLPPKVVSDPGRKKSFLGVLLVLMLN